MIKIDLINNFDPEHSPLSVEESADIADEILSKLDSKVKDATIELIFVKKEGMQKINKDLRNIDKPTDVLSFPQSFHEKAKEKILGSIIISPEMASEEKVDLETLFAHGLLHLLGYDHETNIKKWEEADKAIGRITL
jgi:probable rRNA maturation factor